MLTKLQKFVNYFVVKSIKFSKFLVNASQIIVKFFLSCSYSYLSSILIMLNFYFIDISRSNYKNICCWTLKVYFIILLSIMYIVYLLFNFYNMLVLSLNIYCIEKQCLILVYAKY